MPKAIIYAGPGVGSEAGDTVEALENRVKAAGFEVRRVVPRGRIRPNVLQTQESNPTVFSDELLDSVDVLLVPGAGGSRFPYGDSNYAVGRMFNRGGYDPVLRRAVNDGLGYVGICAGAFFAANYKDQDMDLGDFDRVWATNAGTDTPVVHALMPDGTPVQLRIPLIGGPSFQLQGLPDEVKEVATMHLKEGVRTAAVSFPVGKGRVFLCGPHPEAIEGDPEWDGADSSWRKDPQSVKNNYAWIEAWIQAVARK